MRIATKIVVTLVTLGCLSFGAYGYYMLQAEERDLRRAVEREMTVLARVLRVTAQKHMRDDDEADIKRTVLSLEDLDPKTEVWVFAPGERPIRDEDIGREAPAEVHERIVASFEAAERELGFYPERSPEYVYVSAPLG